MFTKHNWLERLIFLFINFICILPVLLIVGTNAAILWGIIVILTELDLRKYKEKETKKATEGSFE